MRIYLIRHTTPGIEKGKCYGQTDMAVNGDLFDDEYIVIQSKLVASLSKDAAIDKIYASPLKRCATLAHTMIERLPELKCKEVITNDLLMELDFGEWENKYWNNLNKNDVMTWSSDFVNKSPPGGESFKSLHSRSEQFISQYIIENTLKNKQKNKQKNIVIVTHAGNIRSFISYVLGLPLANAFRVSLNYGALVTLEITKDQQSNQLIGID